MNEESSSMTAGALSLLSRDPLRYADVSEPIRRGHAQILYCAPDGVLILEKQSRIKLLADFDSAVCETLLPELVTEDLVVVHTKESAEFLSKRTKMRHINSCYQVGYLKTEKLPETGAFSIRKLDTSRAPEIHRHYRTVDDLGYIETLCDMGVMFGAFDKEDRLLGFIGSHAEGSMGLLHVLPEHRKKGVGEALERFLVNHFLSQGDLPFGQVFFGNAPSMGLQKKLGFTLCEYPLYWLSEQPL